MLPIIMDINQFENLSYDVSLTKLNEFHENGKLCDVILKTTDGGEIHAHKCVLICYSEYFEKMFTGDFVESNETTIVIKNISSYVLKNLISYMYTGKMVKIDGENVEAMLNGADILQFTKFRLLCTNFFMSTINDNNCLFIKDIADSRGITELSQICLEHALTRFHFVSKHISFLSTDITQLKELLESDDLSAPDEKNVYKAVMTWVKHDESDRKHFLPELLSLVRLVFISQNYLIDTIKAEPLISSNPECLKVIKRVTDHFSYKYGDSLSKIITNVKPRYQTENFTTKYTHQPHAICNIPDCRLKNAINLLAYFDNGENYTLFPKIVEWNFGMNEDNFFKEWDEEWTGVNSRNEYYFDDSDEESEDVSETSF